MVANALRAEFPTVYAIAAAVSRSQIASRQGRSLVPKITTSVMLITLTLTGLGSVATHRISAGAPG